MIVVASTLSRTGKTLTDLARRWQHPGPDGLHRGSAPVGAMTTGASDGLKVGWCAWDGLRPVVTAPSGLRDEWVFLANAFVDDDTFDPVHEWTPPIARHRSVAHRATLAVMPYRCLRRYDTASLAAFTWHASPDA